MTLIWKQGSFTMHYVNLAFDFKTQHSLRHAFLVFLGYVVAGMLFMIVTRYLIVTFGFSCVTKIDGREVGMACPSYRAFWHFFLLVFLQVVLTVCAARHKISGSFYIPLILSVIVLGGFVGFALQMPIVVLLSSFKLATSKAASQLLFLAPASAGLLPFLYLLTRPRKKTV